MRARLPAALAVIIALPVLVLACGGGDDTAPPAAPDTPASPAGAQPTAEQPAQAPASPPAQNEASGQPVSSAAPFNFVVEPSGGPCDQSLRLRASGFMPNEILEVVRLGTGGGATILSVEQASPAGEVSSTLARDALGECVLGSEVLFALRKDGEWLSGAIYNVNPPGPLNVQPASVRCGEVVTLTGGGFPPGVSVSLQVGQDRPMAGDFLPAQRSAVADVGGSIRLQLTMGIDAPCPLYNPEASTQQLAFFAHVQGSPERWKAPFTLVR